MVPRTLRTERVLLRQWRAEDVEPLYEIYLQPEYVATMPALDIDQTRAQIDRFRQSWRDDG